MNTKIYLVGLIVSLLFLIIFVLFIQLNIQKEGFTSQDFQTANRSAQQNYISLTDYFTSKDYQKNGGTTEDIYNKLTDYTYAYIQYHDDINTISKQPQVYGIPSGTTFQTDICGNKFTTLVGNNIRTNFTYYTPGTYDRFGTAKYVPSYEDSVYLSKYSTGLQKSAYER